MLAPDKENPPVETAGFKDALTVGGVQVNGGAAAETAVAVISELPAPPYPATTKAGGFRFELDIERMHQSDTWAIAETRLRPFLVMVWIESWTQVPAGSLPDSNAVIAARIGMLLPEFIASREVLMRGWWKANDGRLYHPVVTEQVFDMVKRKNRKAKNQADYRDRQRLKDEGEAEVADHPTATDHEVTGHPVVSDCTTTTTKEQDQKHLPEPEGSRYRNGDFGADDFGVSTEAGPGITILLRGGGEYTVTGTEVADWTSAYPSQDVIGELRKIKVWSIANPTKRKTKGGMPSHINGWLARNANAPPGRRNNTDAHFEGIEEKFANHNGPTVSLL